MATIHVNRGATSLGAFPEEQIREGIRSGRFLGTDLGWKEGMANWQTLSQFSEFAQDFPAATAATAAAPPPQTPAAPATLVAGPATAGVAPRSGLPWDLRHSKGFFSAFIETLQMVLTRPGEAFTAMQREGGLGEPLLYGLIGGSFGYLFYLLFILFMPSLAFMGGGNRHNAFTGMFGMGAGVILAVIFVPIGLTILIFLASAILHVCLMIVGGAKQAFETTFRVVCFSIGSTYPLMIVPLCGGAVASIWTLVLYCIGLARAHETETGRAVFAVLLPLIVCCGLGIICMMIFGGIGAMMDHSNH
ncbi:MAG TPA: YIP1 family protein [Chthoniobacterales bacterium]